MRRRILVVDISGDISAALKEASDQGEFDLSFVCDMAHVMRLVLQQKPALVLISIFSWQKQVEDLLWDLENLYNSRSIRKVIVSATGGVDTKVAALELGADDVLLKPISIRELLARLSAVLRTHPAMPVEEDYQSLGDLRLFRGTMEVSVGDRRMQLSPTEFNLLAYLMENPKQVSSRQKLLDNIWVPSRDIRDRRVVDVYILRLREKIEEDPSQPCRLLTRRGEGYSLVDPREDRI
jgi:two-component system alkaline phosphatase synthesis response regulator PhoP